MKRRKLPPILWIAIISLVVLTLGRFWLSVKLGTMFMLNASVWAIILFGLIAGQKWAFVLTIAIPFFEMALTAMRSGRIALVVAVLNGLVIVPVVICRDYFFPAEKPAPDDA